MQSLPELDMRGFRADPRGAAGTEFVARLRDACHGPGFCYLTGHGVPASVDRALLTAAREFFALPESERRALAIVNSPHFRGHTMLGDEITKGERDWREQLDFGPEEPAVALGPAGPAWLRLPSACAAPLRSTALRPRRRRRGR